MQKALKQLVKQHGGLTDDLNKHLTERTRYQESIDAVKAGGKFGDPEVRALADGRAAIELIDRRLPLLRESIERTDNQIGAALVGVVEKFNKTVHDAIAAKQDEIIELLRPYYFGGLRQAKPDLEKIAPPLIQRMRRALFHMGHPGFGVEKNPSFWGWTAARFFEHQARVAREFGFPTGD